MDAVPDFEDMLRALHHHGVRYLIIGGLAVTFHARPRYTKDMDLWIDPEPENVQRANRALADFGSPTLLTEGELDQVLQIGLPPNRIDLLLEPGPVAFVDAWSDRVESTYGNASANWIGLEALLAIKSSLDGPRHVDDARVLREVKRRRSQG